MGEGLQTTAQWDRFIPEGKVGLTPENQPEQHAVPTEEESRPSPLRQKGPWTEPNTSPETLGDLRTDGTCLTKRVSETRTADADSLQLIRHGQAQRRLLRSTWRGGAGGGCPGQSSRQVRSRNERHPTGQGEVKLPLSAEDVILHLENPKEPPKNDQN